MKMFRRTPLAIVAAATLAIGAVACSKKSSSSSGPTPTPAPPPAATKPNGQPSNFTCNGTNNDPAATTSSITMSLLTLSEPLSGAAQPLGGVSLAEYTLATGTTAGGAAFVTSASGASIGLTTASLIANKRWAFSVTAPASAPEVYVPTYQFNLLTPPPGTTGSTTTFTFLDIPSVIYGAFTGFLGVTSKVVGDMQVAAAISDCDGDAVTNAVVAAVPNCTSGTVPCAGYFIDGAPNSGGVRTDTSGQFVVAGVPPGSVFGIDVQAVETAGSAPVTIGHFSVFGQPNSVGLASVQPLAADTSGN